MSIKSILSAYSGDASDGAELRHALEIAKHHDAWLTGVVRHSQSDLERTLRGIVPKNYLASFFEAERTRVAEIEERFRTITTDSGWSHRCDFVDLSVQNGMTLSEFARPFDLVVTGVHSNAEHESHMSANPDLIALRSGRPVLVVPHGFFSQGLANRAVVAWDGKRASARAIGDAMTTLEEKAKVSIVTVGEKPAPGTDTLLRNLERHGIASELLLKARASSTADTILSVAQEMSAKLVVMGAFEHSKFSHDMFGGVTTEVMRKTDVPVLLSH